MPEPGEARRKSLSVRGNISPGRRSWLRAHVYEFILYIRNKNDPSKDQMVHGNGDQVTIYITAGKGKMIVDLTDLTQQELIAMKQFFDMAFANALPTVIQRDADAEEAYDAGDTSNLRLYREVPRLFVREGPEFHDRPVLLRGPDWTPSLDGSFEAYAPPTRDPSRSIPQRNSTGRGAEDDSA